jgi:UDPglucose--hexose-1-phosphate uridylyltransferase
LIVHTEPNLDGHVPSKDYWGTIPDDFHWHVEMSPDIEEQRGYLGREGLYFNPIPAEEATLVLRALEPGTDPATD